MKTWIVGWPAVSFYLLTLMLSWGYWFTLLALGLRVETGSVSHLPGLLGPMLAAIAVTAVIGGRKALLDLFGRMFLLGPRWSAKLLLALSPLALGAVACIARRHCLTIDCQPFSLGQRFRCGAWHQLAPRQTWLDAACSASR